MPEIDHHFVLLSRLTVSRRIAMEWAALSFGLFLGFLFLFAGVYHGATGETISMSLASPHDAALFLLLSLLPVPLHELTHGAVMRYYSGRPRYGVAIAHFVLPYAYATSKDVYTRGQFIVIALAPLVVLSTVGMLFLPWLPCLLIPLASNAAGSICDLWMTIHLLRFPSDVQLLDERSGLSVYGAAKHQGRVPLKASRGRGFVVAWLTFAGICFSSTLFAFFCVAPLAAGLLQAWGVRSFALGLPESPLLTFRAQDAGISLQEPGVMLLGGACAFSGFLFALARRRTQRPESKPACDQNSGTVTRMCLP
jgi:hypothetical protein